MFRGNCPTRLDEKGRLKIPADFKREIDKSFDAQFYTTSLDGKVLKLFPMKEWEAFEQRIIAATPDFEELDRFQNLTSAYGHTLEMDVQGRLTVPERLREKFDLKGDLAVVGKWTHMDLRPLEEFMKEVDTTPFPLSRMTALLKSRQ